MGGVSPLEDDPFRSTAAHSIGLPQSRPSRRDTVLVKLRPPLDCVKPMRTSLPLYLTRYKSVTVRLTHLVSFYLIYLHVDRFFLPSFVWRNSRNILLFLLSIGCGICKQQPSLWYFTANFIKHLLTTIRKYRPPYLGKSNRTKQT